MKTTAFLIGFLITACSMIAGIVGNEINDAERIGAKAFLYLLSIFLMALCAFGFSMSTAKHNAQPPLIIYLSTGAICCAICLGLIRSGIALVPFIVLVIASSAISLLFAYTVPKIFKYLSHHSSGTG